MVVVRAGGRRPVELERMVVAATVVLAGPGWAGLTFRSAARTMGTSEQPLANRFTSTAQLAATTWAKRLWPTLQALLDDVSRRREPRMLPHAITPALVGDPTLDAAAELLVQSCFNEEVRGEIDATFGVWLRTLVDANSDESARSIYLVALTLGLLLLRRHPDATSWNIEAALRRRARALATAIKSVGVPDVSAPHLDVDPVLDADDPALQALLASCLRLVSTDGYDAVSVRHIARSVGLTEGLIYSRYRSKLSMFQDAARRQQQAGWQLNHEFVQRVERDHGMAMAEAIQWQQFLRPARADARALGLEQLRMTWHNAGVMETWVGELRAFRASLLEQPGWAEFETEGDFILNVAVPYGLYALPLYVPQVDRLPYDVVTIPLYTEFERQVADG